MSNTDISDEQAHVSMLYERLDELRERTETRLRQVLRQTSETRHLQALVERDSSVAMYSERLARLNAVEGGLCFGRLDLQDGAQRHIGRIGILDESADYEPLLVDWRAPAARPFYVATPVSPEGVRRRRHIKTDGRTVVGVDDEILSKGPDGAYESQELTGEAALLAALDTERTGRMGDIVETIQAEQDRVIRAAHDGVLVVQGGPGTGKTVVALHRAAFLLYTYRDLLAKRGVLILGPNATFLRYIEDVLPSLGETGALLSTVEQLYPGVVARRSEPPETAEVKGRLDMAGVIAGAVRDREWVPEDAIEVRFEREVLRLDRRTCTRLRDRARRTRLAHNEARPTLAKGVVDALAAQYAERVGTDPYAHDPLGGNDAPGEENIFDAGELEQLRRELRGDPEVRAAIDRLWPVLTAQQLLDDLFSSPGRLDAAASDLPRPDRELLLRAPGDWTCADIPLLDEAAELLGGDDGSAAYAERRQHEGAEYAQGVLDITTGSRSTDLEDGEEEFLTAADLLDADQLAQRYEESDTRTTAERAASDRTWAFGHVIVDEAQELSGMAWRMLMRRCPTRSMTIVGDPAQTSSRAGASSWADVLRPHVGDRWRLEPLTLNYRTPAEIMRVATGVLGELDPAVEPPRSVRETGVEPWRTEVSAGNLAERLVPIVRAEREAVGDGRLAVIVPSSRLGDIRDALYGAVPDAGTGDDPDLRSAAVLLAPGQAKGLEFDSVIVVEPEQIVADSPHGLGDLYVALTRSTRRLGVVHAGTPLRTLAGIPASDSRDGSAVAR